MAEQQQPGKTLCVYLQAMKILVLNWQDIRNPFGGGAEVHLHQIFSRIAARGHDVTLFCSGFDGAPDREEIDGIQIIREGGRNLFNYYVPRRYKRQFRHEGFDIVIDDINKIPFYTPLYVREPLLAISHHFFGKSIFLEAGRLVGTYVYLAEKLVDLVYRNTPFAVVSESTLQEFMQRGFKRELFSIIPNCIDQDLLPMKIGRKNDHPVIAYFGRLKKYKSVDHVLRAFAQLHRDIPDARLHILGTGTFKPELERLCDTLGIRKKTTFFGYVSDQEKISLLSEAYCAVNPSMKEGWGITNIEANACGTPVLSANVPGLRDSVRDGHSGLLYPYGDIDALAKAMRNLLLDDKARAALSAGAVEWAKRFHWDSSADQMEALAQKVIARHSEKTRKDS